MNRERPILFSAVLGRRSRRGHRDPQAKLFDWKTLHRHHINERRRSQYADKAEEERQRQRDYKKANAEKVNAYNREWSREYRAELRAEMLAAYGGKCACCGEAEPLFLHLDHIHNDGAADRRAHKTSTKLAAHLKRMGWPRDRYRLLCANCNHGRAMNGGTCPHAKSRS